MKKVLKRREIHVLSEGHWDKLLLAGFHSFELFGEVRWQKVWLAIIPLVLFKGKVNGRNQDL